VPADARAAVQKVEDLLIGPNELMLSKFPKGGKSANSMMGLRKIGRP